MLGSFDACDHGDAFQAPHAPEAPEAFDAIVSMGDGLRTWISQHCHPREAAAAEVLIQEGSTKAWLWLIEAGTAQVSTTGSDGAQIPLAELGAGALVGEMSLLEGRPAVASVIAGSPCRVISIEPEALEAAMVRSPGLALDVNSLFARKLAFQLASQNHFIHRWREVSVEPLRKALVVFACLTDVDVEWLARLGRRQRHGDGSVLIRQGELVPELLLVLIGMASVSVASLGGGAVEVGSSRAGELLGEMSLVGGDERASATVTAVGAMEVLAISKDQLKQGLAQDPSRGARFYRAMALMLSQRNRDQLLSRGLAANARKAEGLSVMGASPAPVSSGVAESDLDSEESLDLHQMTSISTAGHRFHWLCQSLGVQR
jgi:bacteriocin-type transport-associated protein